MHALWSRHPISTLDSAISLFLRCKTKINDIKNCPFKGCIPQKDRTQIHFYDISDPYYEFTNFYRRPVHIDGKDWPTTEHYYQAQKFTDSAVKEHIRRMRSPREAFEFSRGHVSDRSNWDDVKEDIMRIALFHKFEQHPDLQEKLIATGGKRLVEHSPRDSYWGDGGDGKGKNRLGELLMEVRQNLRKTPQTHTKKK